ncbi:cytochrome b/b6 domain-containing protein [Glutamicibacter arilaitensis]|uniref:cytochrome b/b6 domain-containing protein n=1 Tax=Glutamicibacter arilaitensis TaxID=256701 RepID=UPI003850C32E
MQGYTPLRQRGDAPTGQPTESSAAAAEAPVDVPVAEPVAEEPAVAEQPPVADEVAEYPAQKKPTAVEEPATQAASVAQPPADAKKRPAEEHPAAGSQGASAIQMKPWVKPAVIVIGAVLLALLVVLAARGLRTLEPIQNFIATYDGHSTMPDSAPVGIPAWLGWQHFLNMFFIVLIIRTGLQVRHEKRPPAMWTPKANSWFSPKGNSPKKYSLSIWTHQALDALWVLNGVVFVILLAITGQWMRVVPTSWDVFPNMISGAIQYASLNWPVENGWIHYNALQMTSYFLVIYVAAPLAILTGVRMSSWWPTEPKALNRVYPIELARKVHFPVMLFFVAFLLVHVFLVFTTGALKNLNHMYASRDAADAWGLVIFLVSVAIVAAAWVFMKPMFLMPVASMTGKISKN